MKLVWLFFVVTILGVSSDDMITPKQFRVELMKNCEVLMLHNERDKKSKKKHTFASRGDCVQNMGCVRNISQKELESMDETSRDIAEWENPIWCYVGVGKKKGWVEKQFLSTKPCNTID